MESPRSFSSSKNGGKIEKCVVLAIARGYQISPSAVKLLQAFLDEKQGEASGDLEAMLELVMEEKARNTLVVTKGGGDVGDATITEKDLLSAFPDLFEEIFSAIKRKQKTITTTFPKDSVSLSATPSLVGQKEAAGIVEEEDASNTGGADVEILNDLSSKIKPVGTEGFSGLFRNRYEKLLKIFRERPESKSLVTTKQASETREGATSRIAGLVYSKRSTKSGSIELAIDDPKGRISVLATNDSMKKAANEVVADQCVMVEVERKGNLLLLRNLLQPDIPKKISSTSKKTVYAMFLSDLHIGSNKFLDGAFTRLLNWLSGSNKIDELDEEIVRRLKYVVIGGDIVDGVGIFPNQENELSESNVFKQYKMVGKKIASIPPRLKVLVVPGNHDSTRQALPQPMIPKKYATPLYDLKNVTMLGDPSLIRLSGVSVLVYHGRSLDDVMAMSPGLSYDRPTDAMKTLLRARHLAPTFGSRTPIAPEDEDYLVIEDVPDIFHTGHVHSVGIDSYKGTLMINSGTFQAQTGYQKNLGIMPRPGLVPIVNLATLEVHLREFLITREFEKTNLAA